MAVNQESLKSARPLIVLFFPYICHGPMNQCIGMGDVLRRRGHRVVIVVNEAWKGKIASFGLEEYVIDLTSSTEKNTAGQSQDFWTEYVRNAIPQFRQSTFVQVETYIKPTWEAVIDDAKSYERHVGRILEEIRPDVVVQDHNACFPTLITSSVPFVRIVSCNPLEIPGANVPPTYSGLSQYDRSEWDAFRAEYNRVLRSVWGEFNRWVKQRGAPSLPDLQFNHPSEYANIYIYPKEADYTADRPLTDKWFRMDSSVRQTDSNYELPMKMRNRLSERSLIYLSLGTLGCADTVLMQRLIDVLSRTRHYFIISKGSSGDRLKLSDSMVGESTLPQTKVIPLVDLVITHGGNNTVTEALHFGKPMLILPILWDQYDNAQRMQDLGFGLRINTYRFVDEELLIALDKLLNDTALRERMARLGERIRERDGLAVGVDVVERVGREYAERSGLA